MSHCWGHCLSSSVVWAARFFLWTHCSRLVKSLWWIWCEVRLWEIISFMTPFTSATLMMNIRPLDPCSSQPREINQKTATRQKEYGCSSGLFFLFIIFSLIHYGLFNVLTTFSVNRISPSLSLDLTLSKHPSLFSSLSSLPLLSSADSILMA